MRKRWGEGGTGNSKIKFDQIKLDGTRNFDTIKSLKYILFSFVENREI